jgi:tetratricopeptide (TPR) repeat protein
MWSNLEGYEMAKDHPTAQEFRGLLRSASELGRSESVRIVRHLLAGCQPCFGSLQAIGWPGERLDRLLHLPGGQRDQVFDGAHPATHGYDYAHAFERTEQSISEFLADPPPPTLPTEALVAELDRHPRGRQEDLIASEPSFADPQFVRCLIERSHEARYEDPEMMLHWASLARIAAERAEPAIAGSVARLADLKARAWGQYGNALRVAGRLREAQEAMAVANGHLATGTRDPVLRARLCEQMASLHTFQRSFDDAISTLQQAEEIYRELGETHSLARTLVQEAIACLYAGEPESAVTLLNRAVPLIDQEEDPHLLFAACHNIVRCYIDLDQPEQALSLLFDAQELFSEFKDSLLVLRAAWQQGQLLRDMGHLRAAESALLRARKGFMERDLAYEVAVVSLDLSAVYVKLGAVAELKQTVVEILPIFRALGVDREALGSVLQLQKIADQEHQALELIRALTARLKRLGQPSEDSVS